MPSPRPSAAFMVLPMTSSQGMRSSSVSGMLLDIFHIGRRMQRIAFGEFDGELPPSPRPRTTCRSR